SLAFDSSEKLLAGIDFAPISGVPDLLSLYDLSNIASPVLLARYNFPVVHQGNSQSFGRVEMSGAPPVSIALSGTNVVLSWPTDRVYALNANNGVLAFEITNGIPWTLQSTPSLTSSWSDLGSATVAG